MSKPIVTVIVVAATMLCITGCHSADMERQSREDVFGTENEESLQQNSEKEDSSTQEPETVDWETYYAGASVDIRDKKSYYTYSGEPITIQYQYGSEGGRSFGIMILCDGVAVPFATSRNEEEEYLQIIQKETLNETVDVDLYVTPAGKSGDVVSIEIVDILEPDYDIDRLDTSGILRPIIFGRKYQVMYVSGIDVKMETEGIIRDVTINENYRSEDIPADVVSANITVDDNGKITNQLDYFRADYTISGEASYLYQVKQGDILEIELTYSGTTGQDIYTSFYLNNERYPVFDGMEYSKAYIDSTHYTYISGRIDTALLEPGRYICYSVCGNVVNSLVSPTNAFIIEVAE